MITFFKFRLSGGRYRLNDNPGPYWPEIEEFDLRDRDQVVKLAANYDPDILGIYECTFDDEFGVGHIFCLNITADIAELIWANMRKDYSDDDPLPKLVQDHIDWQSDVEEMERDGEELAAHEHSYRARP